MTAYPIPMGPEPALDLDRPLQGVAERHRNPEFGAPTGRPFFVTLLGPSAVGKTEIMHRLSAADASIQYVSPFVTRPLRPNEVDKVYVPDDAFAEIEAEGGFLCVNDLYDARYGTPLATVQRIISEGGVPILDFPMDSIGKLARPEYDLVKLYVFPPSIRAWTDRLRESGRVTGTRLDSGLRELSALALATQPHPCIDWSLVSEEGRLDECAADVLLLINQLRS